LNTTIIRADEIEARFERLLVDFGYLQQQVSGLINQLQALQGQGSGQQGGGGNNALYYATNSAELSGATGTTLAGLTPQTFTSTIYTNVAGSLISQATSQTCYWWYLDTLPINSIVPVEPNAAGTGWDAIGGGCTAL